MTLWGGRFESKVDPLAMQLNASLSVDQRLWDVDIRGSVAWARALAKAQVITDTEASALCQGLQAVWAEFNAGTFVFAPNDEDIHTAVERRLSEIVGAVGGKLHTGRSRNDQVVTDFRLWALHALDVLVDRVGTVQATLLSKAEAEFDTLLPGYTHTQRAQPILFSHWLLSHFWALQRDKDRLTQTRTRTSVLPLGSAALAGTGFNLDRQWLADTLGFQTISTNSLDAISDRDFAAEFLFDCALIGTHLSRLADALILYSTTEFGFIEMAEAYSTGSSIMPQKKNADMLELARGKAGTLLGLLTGLLATLKGLPSAYDKDLQEDKPAVFAAFDTLDVLLPVVAGTVATLTVNRDRMRLAVDANVLATDVADYLVRKGLPFRQAHGVVGKLVRLGIEKRVGIDELSLAELQRLSPLFAEDVRGAFDASQAVAARSAIGGTAPVAVRAQIESARALLSQVVHHADDYHWPLHQDEQTRE